VRPTECAATYSRAALESLAVRADEVIDRWNDVSATTLGHLPAKNFQSACGLAQEIDRGFNDKTSRMQLPTSSDSRVNGGRLCSGLDPKRIPVVVPSVQRRRAQVNHGIVAPELLVEPCANGRPDVAGTRPVGDSIDASSIAQDNGRILCFSRKLELTLHVEDRALCGTPNINALVARESPTKYDSRGLWQDPDVHAKVLANELQNRRLARARAAR
jgi:hypothetical protein